MPEFLHLLPPAEARALLLSHLAGPFDRAQGLPEAGYESIASASSVDRVTARDVLAPHPLPEFPRSSVDGYALRARDSFGATESLPAYLTLAGEVPMGAAPAFALAEGQCALIHTGGMLPEGADAVVMVEHTQRISQDKHRRNEEEERSGASARDEIEVLRPAADGENVIRVGEDVEAGAVVLTRGRKLRPAEIGGVMALGILRIDVLPKVRVGLISSGEEVVDAGRQPRRGQVRDVNIHTLASLVAKSGGEPVSYGIVPDEEAALRHTAARALRECDAVVISAGSSASTRDMTAAVIGSLGAPGVLVHGINTRPGKPTILGVCDGKAVIGLPGNPVSALVNGYLFVVPVIEKLLGLPLDAPRPSVSARLAVNLASQAGREDWWPVKLRAQDGGWIAEPIFGKSNLIFTLAAAHGLLRIPPEVTGLAAAEVVEVMLI